MIVSHSRWWLCAAALCAACDPPAAPTPHGTQTGRASGAERAASAPVPQDPAAVARGATLFESACGRCHTGESPSGGPLADLHRTGEQILGTLHAGSEDGGIMATVDPATLREEDIPMLRAYLRSIGAER